MSGKRRIYFWRAVNYPDWTFYHPRRTVKYSVWLIVYSLLFDISHDSRWTDLGDRLIISRKNIRFPRIIHLFIPSRILQKVLCAFIHSERKLAPFSHKTTSSRPHNLMIHKLLFFLNTERTNILTTSISGEHLLKKQTINIVYFSLLYHRAEFHNSIRLSSNLYKMGGKRKINLQIDCEEVTEMEKSIFSEIGSDGLRFLRQGIHIGP